MNSFFEKLKKLKKLKSKTPIEESTKNITYIKEKKPPEIEQIKKPSSKIQDYLSTENFKILHCGNYYPKSKYAEEHKRDELSTDIIKNKFYDNLNLNEKKNAAKRIAQKIYDKIKTSDEFSINDFNLIIPVPNSSQTIPYHSRAVSIAYELSLLTGINYNDKILKKIKDIPNHKSMRRDERIKYHAENQLFDLDDTIVIDNLSILLIDDVKTTSTTFQDCVKQLAKGSPKKILCMAAAETYY